MNQPQQPRISSKRALMHQHHYARLIRLCAVLTLLVGCSAMLLSKLQHPVVTQQQRVIVQSTSSAVAAAAVARAGGTTQTQLGLINAVAARLDASSRQKLANDPQVRAIYPDRRLLPASLGIAQSSQKKSTEPIEAPSVAVGADALQQQKITGSGVTVAVVDTGLAPLGTKGWTPQSDGSIIQGGKKAQNGFLVFRDFVDPTGSDSADPNGHGTHVVGSIANNRALKSNGKASMGVAPGVNLVVARALGPDGSGSYATMIAAIDWIVQQRSVYNIHVLNLSIYAPMASPYWADPLGQAVMRAWQAGIVVVVAAGNDGPNAATVTVPGNVPYVITVGAIKSHLFSDSGADELASFSARGPTESAFPKPDVLVSAVRVIAPMPDDSQLALQVVAGRLQEKAQLNLRVASSKKNVGYYQLSGTSMAAAEVSGEVALLLQNQSSLTNDQVKYRLMTTARLALDQATGRATYSIWEQGAGLVQIGAAVTGTSTDAANQGMDVALDLDQTQDMHPFGQTSYDPASGTFSLPELPSTPPGYLTWNGAGQTLTNPPFWTGDPEVWAGANRVWRGANRVWRGSDNVWAGNVELWAGANRVWRGAVTPNGNTPADVEPRYLDPEVTDPSPTDPPPTQPMPTQTAPQPSPTPAVPGEPQQKYRILLPVVQK